MIDTDETGERKWEEVRREFDRDSDFWTPYEAEFIRGNYRNSYASMTPKRKSFVGRLHEKMETR